MQHSFSHTFSCALALLLLIAAPVTAQETREFHFVEDWAIGDDEAADPEYLFSSPTFIATDSEGRVYVAEHNRTTIRVYDPDGRHVRDIGRSGEGPGEFREVTSMAIDAQDRLVVFDHLNHRITRITDFEEVETVRVPEDGLIHARPLLPLPDGRMVAGYWVYRSERLEYLHVYDGKLDRVGSFGKAEDWNPGTDDFITTYSEQSRALIGTSMPDTSLLLTHRVYDGRFFRYHYNDGAWSLETFRGIEPEHPPYDFVNDVQYTEDGRFAPNFMMFATHSGSWHVMLRAWSRGLFTLPSGQVAHLVALEKDGIVELTLQIINPAGKLVAYGPVPTFETDAEEHWPFRIQLLWIDRENRFYFVDRRAPYPVIRAMRLEGNLPE